MHCSPTQTEYIATVTCMHTGQHAVHSTTMQNGDNYLKDGHWMPPERHRIDVQSANWRSLRAFQAAPSWSSTCIYNMGFNSNGHIRCRLVLFVLCTLPTQHPPCPSVDDDGSSSGMEDLHGWPLAGKTGHGQVGYTIPTQTTCMVKRGVGVQLCRL